MGGIPYSGTGIPLMGRILGSGTSHKTLVRKSSLRDNDEFLFDFSNASRF
jgi:hypothetical protein